MPEDNADEQQPTPWVMQSPTTRLLGTLTGVIYAGSLGSQEKQNDMSFGLIIEDPEVINGSLYRNEARTDDELMADVVDEDQPRSTDYRIIDPDDTDANIVKGSYVSKENDLNVYDETDGFSEDEIIVWYNGMAAERIARAIDFNGQPFARWTDDGYLVKGLIQVPDEWRNANGSMRRELKHDGRGPRVARLPLSRFRVSGEELLEEPEDNDVLIDISRWQGGRAYEAHVFDAGHFENEAGSLDAPLPENDEGFVDATSEIEMRYEENAETILEQLVDEIDSENVTTTDDLISLYHGDGFPDAPEGVAAQTGSFNVEVSTPETNESGFTDRQEQFIGEVVDQLTGTGLTPGEAFTGGLDNLIASKTELFDVVPDVDEVERAVYERVAHLDTDELETTA